MKILLCALLILGSASLLCSCTDSSAKVPQKWQGHWVDVNGDTTLDISAHSMDYTVFGRKESCEVVYIQEGSLFYIAPAQGYSFGVMSKLHLLKDGTMTAYEEILDAEGHTYNFVREEDLAAQREIVDLSEDLPKHIDSNEITSFTLVFTNEYCSYGLDEEWPSGAYCWEISRDAQGVCTMDLRISGSMYIVLDVRQEPSEEFVRGLAAHIQDMGLPALNGYYQKNNVNRHGYYLDVRYASGEKLLIRADGDAAESCVFDLPQLMEYVRGVVRENAMY